MSPVIYETEFPPQHVNECRDRGICELVTVTLSRTHSPRTSLIKIACASFGKTTRSNAVNLPERIGTVTGNIQPSDQSCLTLCIPGLGRNRGKFLVRLRLCVACPHFYRRDRDEWNPSRRPQQRKSGTLLNTSNNWAIAPTRGSPLSPSVSAITTAARHRAPPQRCADQRRCHLRGTINASMHPQTRTRDANQSPALPLLPRRPVENCVGGENKAFEGVVA